MFKKISSKLILIFSIMLFSVASTSITSYLAVDTQEQHLMLTELLSRQKLLIERVVFITINIAEIGEMDRVKFEKKYSEVKENLVVNIEEVDQLFNDSKDRQYNFRGESVDLKFRPEFAELFDQVLDRAIFEWEESKKLINYLTDVKYLADSNKYVEVLQKFEDTKEKLIIESDMIVTICMEESKTKQKISNFIQIMSLVFSAFLFIILVYLITKNFYKPFVDIKRIFIKMAKGEIKNRFKRVEEDEFKELYEHFNYFLDSISEIFKLEDEILLENNLDKVLFYIKNNFKQFLPLKSLEISYKNSENKILSKKIFEDKIENYIDPDIRLDKYNETKVIANTIITPIKINNVCFGVVKFNFENSSSIESTYLNFLQLIENKLSLTFYKNFLFRDLLTIITGALSKMAEAKDPETGYHIIRMSEYAQLIAKKLKEKGEFLSEIDDEFIENILISAPMHDIGKVSIPDNILLKPGKLDNDEWKVMKSHAGAGGLILQKLHSKFEAYNINYFQMAAEIAYSHHEKWDGSGYPNKLKGNDIPLSARIAAVADVFDALMSKRPYKEAFSLEKSYSIIQEGVGTHFDERVVSAFLEVRNDVKKISQKFLE